MTVLLTQRCNIVKITQTFDDVTGVPSDTEEIVHENIACRRDPISVRSSERSEMGANQGVGREVIYTEFKTGVGTEMRILLDSETFYIISVSSILQGIVGHHLEIEVVRTENV